MPAKRKGRRRGSRNKGYFWRAARSIWCANDGGRFVALTDENGERLRDRNCPPAVLKAAYARFELSRPKPGSSAMTVWELSQAYLAHIERTKGAAATLEARADVLFDLCTGYGRKWRKSKAKPTESDRIHSGYGTKPAAELKIGDVYEWLAKHPTWGDGARRMHTQAVRRVMMFGVECGYLDKNPIRGIKIPKGRPRVTCLSPEQEQALLAVARHSLKTAVRVLIRTGMRPGEFAKLTAAHVNDLGDRMELKFDANEVKTRTARSVRVTDPAIIELIRRGVRDHKSGPIFRTAEGKPHVVKNLSRAFFRAMGRATKRHGVKFDDDCCLYSCRHTYAKRLLTGYWSGKPVNIELLAKLMGNSPKVCRDNYLQWSDSYEAPLWEAVG